MEQNEAGGLGFQALAATWWRLRAISVWVLKQERDIYSCFSADVLHV